MSGEDYQADAVSRAAGVDSVIDIEATKLKYDLT